MIQIEILGHLSQQGPRRFSDLLTHLKTSKPTLAHHLGELVEAGDVNRSHVRGGDRREAWYSITKAGAGRLLHMFVLPAVLRELEKGGAEYGSGMPRAGEGLSIVTHTLHRSSSARWMTRGLEDVAWRGLEQGFAEHLGDLLSGSRSGKGTDNSKRDALELAYAAELDRLQGAEMAAREQNRPTKVIIAFEIDVNRILGELRQCARQERVLTLGESKTGHLDQRK